MARFYLMELYDLSNNRAIFKSGYTTGRTADYRLSRIIESSKGHLCPIASRVMRITQKNNYYRGKNND